MIVRISTEGQYELKDEDVGAFNALDSEAVSVCQARDEARFDDTFGQLLDFVRTHGDRVPDDELAPSDVILPPPDSSMDDVRAEFTGEGLIPG